ncbi:leptin-like [Brachionichthys hirsutus]|uniref:leptin-like n=1 Tax=Brachionichthys hirsutus TaxID=412623 RepID=UPI003604657E
MDYILAILFSVMHMVSVGTAAPVTMDVVLMKSKVKWMAEQLVVKLDKNVEIPATLTLSPPTDSLNGPSCIVPVLEGYNSLISDSLIGVSQIKTEISSLTGYLDQWRKVHCSEQWPKLSLPRRIQELQSRKKHVHTVSFEALLRVKEFLNLLLKNLDLLENC